MENEVVRGENLEPFLFLHVKDLELCAQRTDEGEGFPLSFVTSRWREGHCGFLGLHIP
jgi:hypothetical protein